MRADAPEATEMVFGHILIHPRVRRGVQLRLIGIMGSRKRAILSRFIETTGAVSDRIANMLHLNGGSSLRAGLLSIPALNLRVCLPLITVALQGFG